MACTQEYDDSKLLAKMDVLEKQVAALVQQVNDLNTQVQGFNTVIEQWKAGGFVESIREVTGGHTITFVGGQTVTIYDGKDGANGKDASDPVIGVKADSDDALYWTVNGEFLLVDGKKVPVAVVPVFSTNANGELIVTVNGEETNLGKVSAAGDAIFESVVADSDKVVFTLVGGQSFTIPFVKAFKLVIDKIAYAEVKAGDVLEIPYTVQNSDNATVMAFADGFYKAVVDESAKKVNVTVPNPAADGQVMVWAQTEMAVSPIVVLSFTVGPGAEEPTPGESADLECPAPPTVGTVDPTALVGYASAVTGGEGGKVYHFNSGKALQTWLLQRTKDEKKGDHTPVTIWLSGTFKSDEGRDFSDQHPWFDVKDVSNLSFIGTDDFVMDQIGIFCVRASNIVIRNINFRQPKANNGADAVSMQECDGVWVDHCTFTSLNQTKDYEDGSTDVTHGSKNVTVSWCRYIKTQKSCLVGHSNSQSSDTQISVTFHHNWFDNSSSRHPRVRYGVAHVYNNLYDGCTTYGAGSAYGAKVLVEYNYFDGVQLPTDICTYPAKEGDVSNLQGSVAGYLYPTENIYVNRPEKARDPYPLSNVAYTKYGGEAGTPLTYADFQPSYSYTVTAAEDVPEVVKANAGYGKLGFAEAPVEVDNAGITEFNGTDDDPVDPDNDDPDDPSTNPSGPGTYTLYATGSKAVATTGGTYFTYSTETADFRSPSSTSYNGPFNIGGTDYSFGVKMNSSGYVTFTTSATLSTTVQFYFARRKESDSSAKMQLVPTGGDALLFETPFDAPGDSGEIALEKGTEYTIKQKSSEQGLILVIVKETE